MRRTSGGNKPTASSRPVPVERTTQMGGSFARIFGAVIEIGTKLLGDVEGTIKKVKADPTKIQKAKDAALGLATALEDIASGL